MNIHVVDLRHSFPCNRSKVIYYKVKKNKHGSNFGVVRMFLSTLGFCSSDNWRRMTPLKMIMELIEKLDQIDTINHEEGEKEGYEGKKRR